MIYRFGSFELDAAKAELRDDGRPRALEPQVYALLLLLVENRERLVSREELVRKVWRGRVVSDSAVASRVKSARQGLGDDGRSQRYIRTVHGQGFRFVGEVQVSTGAGEARVAAGDAAGETPPGPGERRDTGALSPLLAEDSRGRPSVAVLPFEVLGGDAAHGTLAYALPHDLIAELSRLRWLFVTARGSSFRFRPGEASYDEIARRLGVRYCVAGTVEVADRRLTVTAQLVDARDGRVVWADRFGGGLDDVHAVREEIRRSVLVALDIRIPLHEAALARLAGTEHLDAWAAYHVGLQHLYRFNRRDNAAAGASFGRAIELDAGFARAHAGLSFVHFQTAFLRITDDVAGESGLARRCAERALELDPLDPFVNFTMGRTYWVQGDLDSSLAWLQRATSISPNYAQGIYARGWAEALSGRATEGRGHVDLAMRLSPLDPLYYAMLGTRAFTHLAFGEDAAAASWAERAARSPGAHVLIAMIAAAAHGLAGHEALARHWAADVRARDAALGTADFFRSFPMQQEAMRSRVEGALKRLGF